MIAQWMMYCVAVGVLLSGGAAALESALRPLGRATRWVWAGALLLTLAVPAAARAIGPLRPPPAQTGKVTVTEASPIGFVWSQQTGGVRRWMDALDPAALQRPLALLWLASSAASALALAAMTGALRRRRRGWTQTEVDGVPVLVSPDVGPAVIGVLRSRIVLPRWTMDADERARALVLEHEQEHVRAGDPRLLAAALAAAVITPWNPAVWWMLRRLRLAVEVDCDARVLRRRADVHAYGSVLLEVGRRTSRTRLAASAAFAEPVSTLERRIRIMTAPRVRRPIARAAVFGSLAAALAVAACAAPAPVSTPTPAQNYSTHADATIQARTPRSLLEEFYPQVLRSGMPDGDIIAIVLDADGRVVSHDYLAKPASGNPDIQQALNQIQPDRIAAVNVVKSQPGDLAPTRVQMVVVQLKRA